jgi:tetratricopeptide (TPR) repeat protein
MIKKHTAGGKRPQFFRGLLERIVKSLQTNDSTSENSLDTEISQIQLALEAIDAELRGINAARQVDARQIKGDIQVLGKQYIRDKEEFLEKLNELNNRLDMIIDLVTPEKAISLRRLQSTLRDLTILITGATFVALYEKFVQDEWYPEIRSKLEGILRQFVDQIKSISGDDIRKHYDRAIAANDQGKADEAIKEISLCIGLETDSDQLALMYQFRGRLYSKKDEVNKAISDCEKAISIDPDNPSLVSTLAAVYNVAGALKYFGSYDKGLQAANKAIWLNPRYCYAYLVRGSIYSGMKQYKRAIRDFTLVIKFCGHNDSFAYSIRACAYFHLGRYALRDVNIAINIDPHEAGCYCTRAEIYYSMKKNTFAFADCAKALTLDPTSISKINTNLVREFHRTFPFNR